jgi:hypothetical protein
MFCLHVHGYGSLLRTVALLRETRYRRNEQATSKVFLDLFNRLGSGRFLSMVFGVEITEWI